MATLVGGLRARMIYDSIFNAIQDSLTDLGWFDSGRANLPLNFVSEPVNDTQEIPLNTMVLVPEDMFDLEAEMGSMLSEHRRTFFLDIYAENLSIGEHLAYDIRDIIQGRFPSIGRDGPYFDIYNYALATPVVFTTIDIENVTADRGHDNFAYPWRRNWYSIAFDTVDYYADENDD